MTKTGVGALLARFVATEAASSILLIFAAAVALTVANTPLGSRYHALWHHAATISLAGRQLSWSLGHFVNDGLMAIFFLFVGLEIKRELTHGELAGVRKAALPVIAALGGMAIPALLYTVVTIGTPFGRGWGIPMATDIAFAVGVLALLGARTPSWLTLFLTALAIADDLGAVLVIAIFYAANLTLWALLAAAALLALLLVLNRRGVRHLGPYLGIGLLLWLAILASGIHATIAGVALGLSIPCEEHDGTSPLTRLEHTLAPWVAYAILPLFALANGGVALPWRDLGGALTHPITIGVFVGLVVGKSVGVFGTTVAAVKLRLAELPPGATRRQLLGGSSLAGIGFTMSIFIATLAFPDDRLLDYAKIGIIAASITSAVSGIALLWAQPRARGYLSQSVWMNGALATSLR